MHPPTSPIPPAQALTNYENPKSLGFRFRARRVGPLLKLIRTAHNRYGEVKLLDVGGRKAYWKILPGGFLEQHRVKVTVLNLPDELPPIPDDDVFTHIAGNACDLKEYGDKYFHIVHANSVIEHVGGWANVKAFAAETRRVGQGLFIQTPYFWFPIEPHFVMPLFHWCPRPIQESLVRRLPLGHFKRREPTLEAAIRRVDAAPRLLDLRAYRLLYPDCKIVKERFCLFTKSLVALRDV